MAPQPGAGMETTPSDTGLLLARLKTDAGILTIIKGLEEAIAALRKQARALVDGTLEPGEQRVATMPDGTRIGKIAMSEAPKKLIITNEAEFIAWVQEHCPDNIVPTVRESYWNSLKAQVKDHGYAFDNKTMEIIPGLEVVDDTPRLTPTPNDACRDIVRAMLKDVSSRSEILALPSAERPAA